MPSEEQAREDAALDYLTAECISGAYQPTEEEIEAFADGYELTAEDEAVLADLPESGIMTNFIINKSGRANGSLFVWDCEILEKN